MESLNDAHSQAIIDRLPHREPMRLIQKVQKLSANETVCETIVNEQIARLFSKDGQVDCLVAIELIAQSAAIPLIGKQTPDTAPMAGMLIQIKNYSITQRSIPINSTLNTRVTVEVQPDSVFVMANGQVSFNNTVICEGSVTLAVQQ